MPGLHGISALFLDKNLRFHSTVRVINDVEIVLENWDGMDPVGADLDVLFMEI